MFNKVERMKVKLLRLKAEQKAFQYREDVAKTYYPDTMAEYAGKIAVLEYRLERLK